MRREEATIALRQQMTDINAWLDTADITCSHPQVDPAQRRLRRIFNNSDFAQGGRLYGGFWQAMSSDERQEHILIEDDCCVELGLWTDEPCHPVWDSWETPTRG